MRKCEHGLQAEEQAENTYKQGCYVTIATIHASFQG